MTMRPFKPALKAVAGLALALLMGACGQNPVASSAPPGAITTVYDYPPELTCVSGLFYAPQSSGYYQTLNPDAQVLNCGLTSGTVEYSYGGKWTVKQTSLGTPVPAGIAGQTVNTIYTLPQGFSGGTNDYYVRWAGCFNCPVWGQSLGGIPNSSTDYDSFEVLMTTALGPGFDISNYKGFTFYARGTGDFAVNLVSGSTSTGQTGPYEGYNYYLYMFNNQLAGNQQWKQVTVYFSQMVQTYGTSTDINLVLQQFYGLIFNQQPPLNDNYQLDVDYIRFF